MPGRRCPTLFMATFVMAFALLTDALRDAMDPKLAEGPVAMPSLIEVRDLRVSFRTDKTDLHPAVRGVSFDIPANATVALVGESGSGKSASAMSIVGLLPQNAVIDPA